MAITVMAIIAPRLMVAGAAFAAAMAFAVPASRAAGDAPWCAVIDLGTGDVHWDCEYRTVEECIPNVLAGNRGFCEINPYGPGPAWSAPRGGTHHQHRRRHARP